MTIYYKFLEILSENLNSLEVGIEMAKTHCKLVFQQIQNFVDMNQIVASGPFLQVFLEEVCTLILLYFYINIEI